MVWDQESSLPHIFPLIRSSTPAMAMVFIQLNSAVAIILSKMATDSGMSQFVMVTYRHAVATLVIAPIAFFVERYRVCLLTCTHIFIHEDQSCMVLVHSFILHSACMLKPLVS